MGKKSRNLCVLLIMRDAPDTSAHKGGLFPTVIRYHVELGLDVHVASLSPMASYHEEVIRSLGAKPFTPIIKDRGFVSKVGIFFWNGKKARNAYLSNQESLNRLEKEVAPDVVVGLQSYHTGFAAKEIADYLNAKYVTWEHLSSYETGRRLSAPDDAMVDFFIGSHAVLTVSSSLLSAIDRRFCISLPNARILPNPIPFNFTRTPDAPDPKMVGKYFKFRLHLRIMDDVA
jgi:hypothetical protein